MNRFTHRLMAALVILGVSGTLTLADAMDFKLKAPIPSPPPAKPMPVPVPDPTPIPTPQPAPVGPGVGGTADPVGLISSAAIIPFWASGPFVSIFEITSLGENPDMHVFFFAANCTRVFSLPFAMTAHDADLVFSHDLFLNFNGIAAFAKSTDNITPIALDSAITLRVHRVDFVFDSIAVVDPISARHAEDPTRTWNPLRSGASTVTMDHGTRWWVVCPKSNVVTDLGGGIPPFPPGPDIIRLRAYDLDEHPQLDIQFSCQCLTEIKVDDLHPLFRTNPKYVEMVTYLSPTPIAAPPAFVLYREVRSHGMESFGRAPGMSAATLISGNPVPLAR